MKRALAVASVLSLCLGLLSCNFSSRRDISSAEGVLEYIGRCIKLSKPVFLVKWRDPADVRFPDVERFHLTEVGGWGVPSSIESFKKGEGASDLVEVVEVIRPNTKIELERVWEMTHFETGRWTVFSATLTQDDGQAVMVDISELFDPAWRASLLDEGLAPGRRKPDPSVPLRKDLAVFCSETLEEQSPLGSE